MGSAKTSFKCSTQSAINTKADVLIIGVFKDSLSKTKKSTPKNKKKTAAFTLSPELKALNKALQGMIQSSIDDEGFDGSKNSLLSFRKTPADKISCRRVILVGLGEKEKLKVSFIEKAYAKALSSALTLKSIQSIAISSSPLTEASNESISNSDMIQSIIDASYQTSYRSEESSKKPPALKELIFLLEKPASATLKKAIKEGEAFAKARSLVKDLVNKPANLKQTITMAKVAQAIGKSAGMTTKIQNNTKWLEKNMPCFYEVARGSVNTDQPRFITITYKPQNGKTGSKKSSNKKTKKLALVGKSVMFDTGGYQVKTGNYMNTMKGDMTGGACVLGAMQAIAELKPNIEVRAYLASTPNKIDSQAMIPDSIVNTTCGKKVEIRHTDAEGRLTLIDAVSMAAKDKPNELLTIATLTGSASIAVGARIALMGNDDTLRNKVEQHARSLGEPVQTLDVDEEDYDNIKSKLDGADLRNTQRNKGRGAQTAGAFVMSGAPEGLPVVHLDIAGADMTPDEKATGIGVKTLIRYVLDEATPIPWSTRVNRRCI